MVRSGLINSYSGLAAIGNRAVTAPYGDSSFQLDFDFIDHVLLVSTSDGQKKEIGLFPRSVADFYADVMRSLLELGIEVRIHELPNEIPDAIRFSEDHLHASYDREYAERFWRILVQSARVLSWFRTSFIGKCSPVQFFWGSCDLNVTRFSGRRAHPIPTGAGIPNLPEAVMLDSELEQNSSAGFWPGGSGTDYPAFYSYASPAPPGFSSAPIRPAQAFWSRDLNEYILPYDAVRTADDPEQTLMEFLTSTYEAAATTGNWDRTALECPLGVPDVPRPVARSR